jgi:hypothetical protein
MDSGLKGGERGYAHSNKILLVAATTHCSENLFKGGVLHNMLMILGCVCITSIIIHCLYMHHATSWKVAGPSPDEVDFFSLP